MKTPDYLSYDRYKKKKKDPSKKGMTLAITTFFATLLVFTVVARVLSPDVDVTIGEDTETDAKETGLGVKRFIDERLKMIQMEDTGNSTLEERKAEKEGYNDKGFNEYSRQIEEKVIVPSSKEEIIELDSSDETEAASVHTPPRPKKPNVSPYESPRTAKVYVGRYSTVEQAKVAQEILLDSGLDITPFVKNMGGSYTLQVGSYSSRSTADGVASELLRNNFPARVVQE